MYLFCIFVLCSLPPPPPPPPLLPFIVNVFQIGCQLSYYYYYYFFFFSVPKLLLLLVQLLLLLLMNMMMTMMMITTTTATMTITTTTRGANAQTIYVRHTYRTPESSPLLNQPSRTFELLHAILQQNNCTSSSFTLTLWLWVSIKVIQTGSNCRV